MVSSYNLSLLALLGRSLAAPQYMPTTPVTQAGCGELNVFYTGFAAYHPWVSAQGIPLEEADQGLRWGAAALVKAGFNVQVDFQGTEQPISNLATRLEDKIWDFAAVGFGMRGFRNGTATARFEDILSLFDQLAPNATGVYNWGPDSFVEAVTRRVELSEDCIDQPGKLIGYEEICDPSLCEKTTNILDGDVSKLTYDQK